MPEKQKMVNQTDDIVKQANLKYFLKQAGLLTYFFHTDCPSIPFKLSETDDIWLEFLSVHEFFQPSLNLLFVFRWWKRAKNVYQRSRLRSSSKQLQTSSLVTQSRRTQLQQMQKWMSSHDVVTGQSLSGCFYLHDFSTQVKLMEDVTDRSVHLTVFKRNSL